MIRQRHLGCGTMMYNNNKNIYFQAASDYAKLLDEASEIYDKAAETQFSINPWETTETPLSHRNRFPEPEYMAALQSCWARWHRHGGGKGTSVETDKAIPHCRADH